MHDLSTYQEENLFVAIKCLKNLIIQGVEHGAITQSHSVLKSLYNDYMGERGRDDEKLEVQNDL